MKKLSFGIFLSIISFFNLSMYWAPSLGTLNQQDIELAKKQEPALSSSIGEVPAWESYGEWQCFPLNAIEIRYIKYCKPEGCDPQTDYDVPSINVEYGGHFYEFAYDFELSRRQETVRNWKDLLQNQTNICLYAAMLPTNVIDTGDPNQSFWTLYNVKTKNGIWKKENYPYLESEAVTKEPSDLSWIQVYDYVQQNHEERIPIGGGCAGVGVAGFLLGGGSTFSPTRTQPLDLRPLEKT